MGIHKVVSSFVCRLSRLRIFLCLSFRTELNNAHWLAEKNAGSSARDPKMHLIAWKTNAGY